MKAKLEHYLATIYLGRYHMHSYVMSDERRTVDAVLNEMIDLAESLENVRVLPVGLLTTLNKSGVKAVRGMLVEQGPPEVKQALATATDFHRTTWVMEADDPADQKLMELH